MNRPLIAVSTALLLAPAVSLAAAGPTGTLYIVSNQEYGGNDGLELVQGGTLNSFPTGNPVDISIAAYGDIRTMGYSQTDSGSRFNLAGSPLAGGPYTNNIANSQLHDGTSDANHNYSINYTTGDVLEFDRNWASPNVLFNVTSTNPGGGWITMNAADGTFWVSPWGTGDLVTHYSHAGAVLSSFNAGLAGTSGLAYDRLDNSLWLSDGSNTLYQYNLSGTLLQSPTYAHNGIWYGMEFDNTTAPEPASLAVLALGAGFMLFRKRR
jgi:hypothetical protein